MGQAGARGACCDEWEWLCRKYKGTNGGLAVQFGACKDSQTAADTASLSGGTHTGAATFLFIQACERLIKHQQPLTCALSSHVFCRALS